MSTPLNFTLFAALFIAQFVGHRIGDYLIQTDWQATNKVTNAYARFSHCFWYSMAVAIMACLIEPQALYFVFFLTLIEHFIIDSRKPVIWWKTFLERRIAGNRNFNISSVPPFVIVETDQTIHIVRIFIISYIVATYF